MISAEENPLFVKPVSFSSLQHKLTEIRRRHPGVTAVLVALVCRAFNQYAGTV